MANKMTKKDYFKVIMEKYPLTEAEREFCEKQIELLDKRNSGEKKPTATQIENEKIKVDLIEAMEPNMVYTITDLTKLFDVEISNQKMSALVKQLVLEGKVKRFEEKRKAYFQLV